MKEKLNVNLQIEKITKHASVISIEESLKDIEPINWGVGDTESNTNKTRFDLLKSYSLEQFALFLLNEYVYWLDYGACNQKRFNDYTNKPITREQIEEWLNTKVSKQEEEAVNQFKKAWEEGKYNDE